MKRIYRKTTLDEIPWNFENIPDFLTGLIESGQVEPCKTIDLGRSIGNYSVYLASVALMLQESIFHQPLQRWQKKMHRKRGLNVIFLKMF